MHVPIPSVHPSVSHMLSTQIKPLHEVLTKSSAVLLPPNTNKTGGKYKVQYFFGYTLTSLFPPSLAFEKTQ